MRDYAFFFGIMRIMRSEPNYAISHPRIIPEALFLRVRDGWSQ